MESEAYRLIEAFYGTKKANRSQVPLINHINEGLTILRSLGAGQVVLDAYCLHPMLQADQDFVLNKSLDFGDVKTESIILAMEYRRVANSYLSKDKLEDFVGFSCGEVKLMLIADKVQNYKDFMAYHYGTHENSDRLYEYFHDWFKLLDIKYEYFEALKL